MKCIQGGDGGLEMQTGSASSHTWLHSGALSPADTQMEGLFFSYTPTGTGFPFSSPTSNIPIQGKAESTLRISSGVRGVGAVLGPGAAPLLLLPAQGRAV